MVLTLPISHQYTYLRQSVPGFFAFKKKNNNFNSYRE